MIQWILWFESAIHCNLFLTCITFRMLGVSAAILVQYICSGTLTSCLVSTMMQEDMRSCATLWASEKGAARDFTSLLSQDLALLLQNFIFCPTLARILHSLSRSRPQNIPQVNIYTGWMFQSHSCLLPWKCAVRQNHQSCTCLYKTSLAAFFKTQITFCSLRTWNLLIPFYTHIYILQESCLSPTHASVSSCPPLHLMDYSY